MNALSRITVLLLLAASAASASADGFLSDRHAAKGVACSSCHPDSASKNVPQKNCLSCHGNSYPTLAEQTDKGDMNYHDTHLGEIACSDCHRGHSASVLACNQCHQFKVKVP